MEKATVAPHAPESLWSRLFSELQKHNEFQLVDEFQPMMGWMSWGVGFNRYVIRPLFVQNIF